MVRKLHLSPMGKIRKLKKSTSKHFRKTTPKSVSREANMLLEKLNEAERVSLESQARGDTYDERHKRL